MDIENFKVAWQKQETVGYSPSELDSIYHIKKSHALDNLKSGLSWDLLSSIVLAVLFIILLQVLNLKTSNFWSVCMGILAIQHIVFYQLQAYFIRKYSIFKHNVVQSLEESIRKVNLLLWFYRVWPATLTVILYSTYFGMFNPGWPLAQILLLGTILALGIAGLSNIISAVLVRKYIKRLIRLKDELTSQSKI